ncbi:MAG: hypothetical protein HETSPECPRED_004258 [Heterodermia speciosa]|uniref:Uncharacterized protein n=1 Tax=Heterodermia speciosa TaxID=116794 RepID=A0A8H3PJJ2_9LECA|nr:MAG: hypothetical protein HETSPECPRED_004258 [Heterodermia speciosa]
MHYINIHNKSDHDQEFEVHGFNGGKNINVKPHATTVLPAADGQSGAIIALHDGHEGEQAEITKDGFGGNDFIDLSNIVGAGGNMTVQQVGEPSTRKGDPLFMQQLNTAWHKASKTEKDSLRNCVHTNSKGDIIRIDAIKDHPELEKFIRSFADGKTYIGVGAWGGSPGVGSDNNQSSAAHGNKDILITYSDDDATPNQPPHLAHRPLQKMLVPHHTAAPSPAQHAFDGAGIHLSNKSKLRCTYFFYDNLWNGNGTAGPNFTHPLKSITLAAAASAFVPLPASFKGRLQRGTLLPATWVEFQLCAENDRAAHADVSVEQGCDGAATVAATDGSAARNGFVKDVLEGAPQGALVRRSDGVRCLASTMGNWMAGANEEAVEWLRKEIGMEKAYVKGGTGVPDVASRNGVLAVDMY